MSEKYGSLSAAAVAKETVFGSPVAVSTISGLTGAATQYNGSFLPMTNITVDPDPGLFSPKLMLGYRDVNIFPLYGQLKNAGAVDGPIFPTNGIQFLVAAIGADNTQTGSVYTGTIANGTLGSAAVGATTVAYTVTNATQAPTSWGASSSTPVFLQVGPAVATFGSWAAPNPASAQQVLAITSVSGTTSPYTLTLATGTQVQQAITSSSVAQRCQAPFFHNIGSSNTLPSLTVEKNAGGFESLQFAGARVNKYNIKATTGDTEAQCTIDLIAQQANILDTPTAIVVTNETPFTFAEAELSLFGTNLVQGTNFTMDIDNSLKSTYTYNGTHELQFLTPVSRMITGQFDVVYFSYDDAVYGYESLMMQGAQGQLQFGLQHPGTLTSDPNWGIQLNMPTVNIGKYSQAIKVDDVIIDTFNYTAFLDIATSSPSALTAVIANGTPFGY